jgi:putative phosphoribosyl transferase
MLFEDRREAGRALATQLAALAREHPVVVALPRGGVPVGIEVARALGLPLDVLAVRKLGAPGDPELAVGAIAEDGSAVIDADTARLVGMTPELLEATLAREARELRRRVARYRAGRAPADVHGRTVLVVDDGMATGMTDLAAVRALRARGAKRIVVAVPVAGGEAVALVAEEADEVVCHSIPHDFLSVGHWYRDFSPVSDDEVLALLATASAVPAPPSGALPTRGARAAELSLTVGDVVLAAELTLPLFARGLVIFAHGSGSGRTSPRNRAMASALNDARFATLLLDLLTEHEEQRRELVFDIPLLARRLEIVTRWAVEDRATADLPIGYFGSSTGAAAAVRAAAAAGDVVRAVVSRGGRPDLAADRLAMVTAPTLLIAGGRDPEVLELNRRAATMLRCPHKLVVVDGAGHLFAEPGALDTVARLASDWFGGHLTAAPQRLAAART